MSPESKTFQEAPAPLPGTAAAVVQAIHAPPHLSGEDVDELDRLIAAGRLPVTVPGVFERGLSE